MRKALVAALTLAFCTGAAAQELTTTLQKISYGIGLQFAQSLRQQGMTNIDIEALAMAVEDALAGNNVKLTREELSAAFTEFQSELNAEREVEGKANAEAGEAFLAEQKEKEGITALESGVLYEVIDEGSGEKPAASDTVVVHYTGRLLDGTVFDSSVERGQPAEFGVTQVIKGWQEALQLMPVGAKWRVWIPASLAYGAQGRPPTIGPNSVLDFDIELIEIKK